MPLARITAGTGGTPLFVSLLCEAAAEVGASVFADTAFGYVGYIEFAGGKRSFFRNTAFDINPQAASAIARDKDYCALMLRQFGHPVPAHVALCAPRYVERIRLKNEAVAARLGFTEPAQAFVAAHGFPLFVKPNEGAEGRGVSTVDSIEALFATVEALFAHDDIVLVQAPAAGRDYRVVVFDGAVVAAYERVPFGITGDGRRAIAELLEIAIARLRTAKRGAKVAADDPRIAVELKRQGLSLQSVVEAGRTVPLLPNANLSAGGRAVDITDRIDAAYTAIAVKVARDLGLVLAGIDIIADDLCGAPGTYAILEVNAAPDLTNFAGASTDNEARASALFRRLIAKLGEN